MLGFFTDSNIYREFRDSRLVSSFQNFVEDNYRMLFELGGLLVLNACIAYMSTVSEEDKTNVTFSGSGDFHGNGFGGGGW